MDKELLIPYGLDSQGHLVKAEDAIRGVGYVCPECWSPLVYRAGEVVTQHFAHKSNTACTGESILHITAKMLIALAIDAHCESEGNSHISMRCTCECCKKYFKLNLPKNAFSSSKQEERVGSFICDVVAMRDGHPALAIEVLATHAVGEEKAKQLAIPWIELKAENILADPNYWHPVASKLKPVICPSCKDHLKKIDAVANRWNLPFREAARFSESTRAVYLAELETCFKCKQEILVYWWSGVPFCDVEPSKPRPRTISFCRTKKFGGSYWANTCPNCHAIQGDNYLFLGSAPVVKGLPLRDTSEMKAHRQAGSRDLINHMLRNF